MSPCSSRVTAARPRELPISRPALAALAGGVLWIAYGIFEFLEPWGEGRGPYRPDLGYELVADALLYAVYSFTGGAALQLTVIALLGFSAAGRGIARVGRVLAYVAGAFGALAIVGVILQLVPLFWLGLVFGSLLLGLAALAVGIGALRDRALPTSASLLIVAGVLGVLMLPLRPLVYALMLVPPVGGAGFVALFGLGWLVLGVMSFRTARSP